MHVEKGPIEGVPRVCFSSRWAARSVAQNPKPDADFLVLTRGLVNVQQANPKTSGGKRFNSM